MPDGFGGKRQVFSVRARSFYQQCGIFHVGDWSASVPLAFALQPGRLRSLPSSNSFLMTGSALFRSWSGRVRLYLGYSVMAITAGMMKSLLIIHHGRFGVVFQLDLGNIG